MTTFTGANAAGPTASTLGRRLSIPNLSASPKAPAAGHTSLNRTASASTVGGATGGAFAAFVYPPAASTPSNALTDANETDENKASHLRI